MRSSYEEPSAGRRPSGRSTSGADQSGPGLDNSGSITPKRPAGNVAGHSGREGSEKSGTVGTELRRIFIHIRWPVQSYVLLGFLFGSIVAKHPVTVDVVLGLVSWFLICAGLTVFNSYYDKDEDPVGGMAKPPKVTASLLYGSLVMQAAGLILAIVLGGVFLYLAIAVIVLYILYSHRLFRFKSNGYAAVLINAILGSLTILAAASLGPAAGTAPLVLAASSAALFKASVYMMMQVHQIEEDKARGDISVAVMFGRNKTLRGSLLFAVLAGVCGAAALATTHAYVLAVLVLGYFVILGYRFGSWVRQPAGLRLTMLRFGKWCICRVTWAVSYASGLIYISMWRASIEQSGRRQQGRWHGERQKCGTLNHPGGLRRLFHVRRGQEAVLEARACQHSAHPPGHGLPGPARDVVGGGAGGVRRRLVAGDGHVDTTTCCRERVQPGGQHLVGGQAGRVP